jgi:hypothetical protein
MMKVLERNAKTFNELDGGSAATAFLIIQIPKNIRKR